MNTPTTTGYETLDKLHTEAQRLNLDIDLTYSKRSQQHWVIATNTVDIGAVVLVSDDTYEGAINQALQKMETIR